MKIIVSSITFTILLVGSLPAQSYNVYRTDQFGMKQITPAHVVESTPDGSLNVYNVNRLGLKEITPSRVIEPTGVQQNSFGNNAFSRQR